jgi:FkbM family methyltransferase
MNQFLFKIKYQLWDLVFNARLFTFDTLVKYYYHSYFLRRENILVDIKTNEGKINKLMIRCRNRIDRNVLHYVFVQNFHHTLSSHLYKPNPVIVDLGCNIGFTVLDMKLHYPGAIIFGYEMDRDNYNLAVINCNNYNDVHLYNKAVWIKRDLIGYNKNDKTDAYSINIDFGQNDFKVEALTVNDIICENGIERIDFLKMDIEGAEKSILSEKDLMWLDIVLSFNIEFHDIDEAELQAFIELFRTRGFIVNKSLRHWNALEGIKNHRQ